MVKELVNIVIPTFNRKETLGALLRQINALEPVENVDIKSVVVIDGSTDGTVEMLRNEFSEVTCIYGDGNWWWTRCINEGSQYAIKQKADFILWMNDDSEVQPDYFKKLWADYHSIAGECVLGSASISLEPKDTIDFAGTKDFRFWRMKSVLYRRPFTKIDENFKGVYPTWTLNGRGTFFPVSLVEKIGLLDEHFVQYGSDYDFTLNARKKKNVSVFISWNARVYNNLMMTSEGATFKNAPISKFLKTFFNRYSVNYVGKSYYIYSKYCNKWFAPLFIVIHFLGTSRAYVRRKYISRS